MCGRVFNIEYKFLPLSSRTDNNYVVRGIKCVLLNLNCRTDIQIFFVFVIKYQRLAIRRPNFIRQSFAETFFRNFIKLNNFFFCSKQ